MQRKKRERLTEKLREKREKRMKERGKERKRGQNSNGVRYTTTEVYIFFTFMGILS